MQLNIAMLCHLIQKLSLWSQATAALYHYIVPFDLCTLFVVTGQCCSILLGCAIQSKSSLCGCTPVLLNIATSCHSIHVLSLWLPASAAQYCYIAPFNPRALPVVAHQCCSILLHHTIQPMYSLCSHQPMLLNIAKLHH